MATAEIISKNLSDEESIVTYMNKLFIKPKDALCDSSLRSYNDRLKK